ncbi:MAG: ribosome small subunit-dependent GTPase A [Bacteroidales bacterium]|nr:ribosome small subunit-dependent GTPase A [Bacteroidales bacterium]
MIKKINKGIVVRSTGSWYEVRTEVGEVISCKFKGKFKIAGIKSTNPIAVGDRVSFIRMEEEDTGVIDSIEKRTNYIIRKSTKLSKLTHIIAANIDYALLVITISQPRTSTGFIDRFLLTAEAYHIPAVLVFNKLDINTKEEQEVQEDWIEKYTKLGYDCLQTSALTAQGIPKLKELMKDKTSMFGGHSGVGKSALINTIQPGVQLKTAEISTFNQKGKHTTTFAEMHPLDIGGFIIDTPGIKEFGLVNFEKGDVAAYFPEMRALMHLCKFNNCLHHNEPICAVKDAVESGEIAQSRYNNYLAIIMDEDIKKKPF